MSNYNRPNQTRDTKDLVAIVRGMVRTTRCPGGRITAYGYVCMHCGVDFTNRDNNGFCGQPVNEDGYTTFNAAEARRILSDSEKGYLEGMEDDDDG